MCVLCSSVGGVGHPSDYGERQDGDGAAPKDMYKRVQSGGDIPAKGLQKPAPEKPRGTFLSWLPFRGVIHPCVCGTSSSVVFSSEPNDGFCGVLFRSQAFF